MVMTTAQLEHDASADTVAIGGVLADPQLYNEDLAPVPRDRRTWTGYSLFAMWMSDVHSVGGYTFAASLFFFGLTGWQVLLAMTLGILVVYVLMNMVGRPSLVHGIPFPVMARVSLGVMGANLAAIIRGVVGVVWYGVQTYFASKAVATLIILFVPSAAALANSGFAGLDTLGWISFLFMWFFQLMIFQRGMEAIRKFIDFCGPAVYVVMFVLMGWILYHAGFDALTLSLNDEVLTGWQTFTHMTNAVLLVVSYFAALLLNFGDFSRFGKSERQMKVGNFLGLPVNFLLFAIVVVIVTAGSVSVFGEMKLATMLIPTVAMTNVSPPSRMAKPESIRCTVSIGSVISSPNTGTVAEAVITVSREKNKKLIGSPRKFPFRTALKLFP